MKRAVYRGVTLMLTLATAVQADEIYRRGSASPLRGEIVDENREYVAVKTSNATEAQRIPINAIDRVRYGESVGLNVWQGEIHEAGGQHEKAISVFQEALSSATPGQPVHRAAEFGICRALTSLALADTARIPDALKAIAEFRAKNPASRYHYTLCELEGKLLQAQGDLPKALAAYGELRSAPWPEYGLQADLYEANILLQEGKAQAAVQKFDNVIQISGNDYVNQRQQATVGKAEGMIELEDYEQATALLRELIASIPGKTQPELQAQAFNLLGDAMRRQGKAQEAVLAYLYVDLIHPESAAHAKALYYLQELWDQTGQSARASDQRERLMKSYPNSPWTKRLAR